MPRPAPRNQGARPVRVNRRWFGLSPKPLPFDVWVHVAREAKARNIRSNNHEAIQALIQEITR